MRSRWAKSTSTYSARALWKSLLAVSTEVTGPVEDDGLADVLEPLAALADVR